MSKMKTEALRVIREERPPEANGRIPGKYRVHEIVCSIQGEGARMGIPTTFLRFSQCDLACSFCDTAHQKGEYMDVEEILAAIAAFGVNPVSLCGGEPTLQVDDELMNALKVAGHYVTIETHGGNPVHPLVDWVVVSPKVSNAAMEAALAGRGIDELKYVVKAGQKLPEPPMNARHYFLSAIYDWDDKVQANMDHARDLVMAATADPDLPNWKLTLQAHKTWGFV